MHIRLARARLAPSQLSGHWGQPLEAFRVLTECQFKQSYRYSYGRHQRCFRVGSRTDGEHLDRKALGSGEHLDRKRHQNMESIPNSPLHWSLTGKTVSSTADITTLLEMIPDPADSRCDAGRPRSS